MSQRNGKTLARALLKYSSSVLFLLWALGLWGLYAVRIFKGMVATNLYVQITCPVMADLQPVLCLLICFAGLATLYGVALTVGKHYFGKTLHTAMTLGCFGFYLAIFVCDMVLLGQIWYFGALRGAFAVVLSVLTCVCAALQVILMLIDGYLSDSIRPAVRKCGTVVKSIGKRLWASRILTLSLTAAIIVCVTLAAVLPATLCNRFRQGAQVDGRSAGFQRDGGLIGFKYGDDRDPRRRRRLVHGQRT